MKKRELARPKKRKSTDDRLVAMTVKIESDMYVRLSTFRAKERKTAQQIFTAALAAYLDRAGA
jgi:predicted transcriptional regulator